MYLILHADTISEWDSSAGSCIIEFSKKDVKSWLDKIAQAKKLKKQDDDFRRMEYYGIASWIRKITDDNKQKVVAKIELNDNSDEDKDDNTTVSTEIDRIEIDDDSIMFSAFLRDTDIQVESNTFYEEELKEIYKALACRRNRVPLLLATTKNSIVKSILLLRTKGET